MKCPDPCLARSTDVLPRLWGAVCRCCISRTASVVLSALVLIGGLDGIAHALPATSDSAPDSVSILPQVSDLMRLDAEQALQHALEQARQQSGTAAPIAVGERGVAAVGSQRHTVGHVGRLVDDGALHPPTLLAMYGSGRRVQVVLRDAAGVHLLVQGRSTDASRMPPENPTTEWSIAEVSGRCVSLYRRDSSPDQKIAPMTRLCMTPGRWMELP